MRDHAWLVLAVLLLCTRRDSLSVVASRALYGSARRVAGDRYLLAALRHLRAEQRGHGTERQDMARKEEVNKSLPFAECIKVLAIYLR